MKVISQRELRNQNATIARDVANGETFEVQRHGKTAMYVVPSEIYEALATDGEMRCTSRASMKFDWDTAQQRNVNLTESLAELRELEEW